MHTSCFLMALKQSVSISRWCFNSSVSYPCHKVSHTQRQPCRHVTMWGFQTTSSKQLPGVAAQQSGCFVALTWLGHIARSSSLWRGCFFGGRLIYRSIALQGRETEGEERELRRCRMKRKQTEHRKRTEGRDEKTLPCILIDYKINNTHPATRCGGRYGLQS